MRQNAYGMGVPREQLAMAQDVLLLVVPRETNVCTCLDIANAFFGLVSEESCNCINAQDTTCSVLM